MKPLSIQESIKKVKDISLKTISLKIIRKNICIWIYSILMAWENQNYLSDLPTQSITFQTIPTKILPKLFKDIEQVLLL